MLKRKDEWGPDPLSRLANSRWSYQQYCWIDFYPEWECSQCGGCEWCCPYSDDADDGEVPPHEAEDPHVSDWVAFFKELRGQ